MNIIGIYDLNNLSFLQNDIEDISTKIDTLYLVDFKNDLFISKTRLDNNRHWTSDESNSIFNALIPTIKTLTKDMYAIIETIHKDELGKYDKRVIESLELQYPNFKEFRLLNNKFKHHNDTDAEIQVTKMVLMDGIGQYIDVYVNYKYQDRFDGKFFSEFLSLFFKILEDKKVVTINRAN
ncbi:MAG: hypothetical protein K0S26_1406 [Bacteroidota bacterium]|nr:hypothetical protein [Bacteroidota bacterium]